jgi:hypothetical protein
LFERTYRPDRSALDWAIVRTMDDSEEGFCAKTRRSSGI